MPGLNYRRNTQQRQVILEELRRLRTHPTASELYEQVRQRLPKISLGTVYRNLELLNQAGLIRKLEFSGAEARFDGEVTDHYHVRCTVCGRLQDVPEFDTDLRRRQIDSLCGFEILGHRLEFFGICPGCRDSTGS
jgi:Fur family ferric uptake transcriptional regulator